MSIYLLELKNETQQNSLGFIVTVLLSISKGTLTKFGRGAPDHG
jgi:hypothetical protein